MAKFRVGSEGSMKVLNLQPTVGFECPDCGGRIAYRTGPGRTAMWRVEAPELPVPDDFPIQQCDGCGEMYFSPQDYEALTPHLEREYAKWVDATSTPISTK